MSFKILCNTICFTLSYKDTLCEYVPFYNSKVSYVAFRKYLLFTVIKLRYKLISEKLQETISLNCGPRLVLKAMAQEKGSLKSSTQVSLWSGVLLSRIYYHYS